ncbi:response regulator [Rhodobacter capsulatus]|uniref:response regulator n=1 Tax=Rhodobacter capsulatus TaxID=1061 RepID=UPI004029423A
MKTIYLVDDSPTMLMSMETALTRAGYAVAKASSAEAALQGLAGGTRPNLMITDLHMGGMNGIDLIREVRKTPAGRFMPILMLTTESAQSRKEEAKSAGATGWIVKPVDPDALVNVVRQVLPGS